MRLGTYYRALMWDKLGIRADQDKVLDVGGFDGYWLSQQPAKMRICVDLSPQRQYEGVTYVKADALSLPFSAGCFDQVFAFDIIEHVNDDRQFLNELHRVTKPSGQIVISTPHKQIRIFPPFLTAWVNKKWGHYRVSGYLEAELLRIMPLDVDVEFVHLKEPSRRFLYLLLRLLWGISQAITRPLARATVYVDFLLLTGDGGHILAKVTKNQRLTDGQS